MGGAQADISLRRVVLVELILLAFLLGEVSKAAKLRHLEPSILALG